MIDILFNGVGWTDIALTLNRIAVGMFFMLSGYHKLFNPQRHGAFVDELKGLGVHAVGFNQWWVPTIEFSAGGTIRREVIQPTGKVTTTEFNLKGMPTGFVIDPDNTLLKEVVTKQ